ncbi:MAG: TdeIII family type II restriction endonuclease [Anaerolineales bacterium]
MTISFEQQQLIQQTIADCLRGKFDSYKPETLAMPFHTRLLGADRMALYSFIHSLNTSFGVSIFEPVAESLAKTRFAQVETQYAVGNQISAGAQQVIQEILNDLSAAVMPVNKPEEVERIRAVCQSGQMKTLKVVRADVCLRDSSGAWYLFDLKTAKPNASNFKDFKRTLLEWCAIHLAQQPDAEIHSLIAIPYNPYAPKPYQRWTLRGMLDLPHELKVAEEFWNFLGGSGAYDEVLGCFERVGIALRPEIDAYFAKFAV